MAILRVKNKYGVSYRVYLRGSDGKPITRTFKDRTEAKRYETKIEFQLQNGELVEKQVNSLTVDEFFASSFEESHTKTCQGWKVRKLQMYRDYVSPIIGRLKLKAVRGNHINKVLNSIAKKGRSPQLQLHVYNMLRKLFNDAVEDFGYLTHSPVRRKNKPIVPKRETPHLKLDQAKELLLHVQGKSYEVAIWLEVYVGLRAGEIQALTWEDVDLEEGRIYIRRTYVRNEKVLRDYPKEKKWRSAKLPPELLDLLRMQRGVSSLHVAKSPRRKGMLSYDGYLKAVKRYCEELGFPKVATHGLRHTFSGVFKSHGGSNELLQRHHNHSSIRVTEKYVHDDHSEVDEVMGNILLFPEKKVAPAENS